MKRLSVVDAERCVGCQCCMFACSRRTNSHGLSEACIGVRSSDQLPKPEKVMSYSSPVLFTFYLLRYSCYFVPSERYYYFEGPP